MAKTAVKRRKKENRVWVVRDVQDGFLMGLVAGNKEWPRAFLCRAQVKEFPTRRAAELAIADSRGYGAIMGYGDNWTKRESYKIELRCSVR